MGEKSSGTQRVAAEERADLEPRDELEAVEDMAQDVGGGVQVVQLRCLQADGGVRLHHLRAHPAHRRLQRVHRQIDALAQHSCAGESTSMPTRGSLAVGCEEQACVSSRSDSAGVPYLHEGLGIVQAVCLLQKLVLPPAYLLPNSLLECFDALLQLDRLCLEPRYEFGLLSSWRVNHAHISVSVHLCHLATSGRHDRARVPPGLSLTTCSRNCWQIPLH